VTCKKTNKQVHSKGSATAHLKHLQKTFNYVGKVYPCVYCFGWHVGREKKNAHKNDLAIKEL